MNTPKRYTIVATVDAEGFLYTHKREESCGEWVKWEEHNTAMASQKISIAEIIRQAHLEVGEMTEVQRLKEQVESLTIVNALLQEKVRAYQLLKNFKRETTN